MVIKQAILALGLLAASGTSSAAQSTNIDSFIEQVRTSCLEGPVEGFLANPGEATKMPNFETFHFKPWSGGAILFSAPEKFDAGTGWRLDVHLHKTGRRSHCYGQIAQPMDDVAKALSKMREAEPLKKFSANYTSGNIILLRLPNPVITKKDGKSREAFSTMAVILSETETTFLEGPLTIMVGLHD